MLFEHAVPFRGDSEKALKVICDALTANNFRIESRDAQRVTFTSPGIGNTRENPLRGVSTGEVSVSAGNLTFKGETRSIQRLIWFLVVFMIGMVIFFLILFGVILRKQVGPQAAYIAPLPFVPWIFLIPLIARMMRRKTQSAIQTLLHNAATMGNA